MSTSTTIMLPPPFTGPLIFSPEGDGTRVVDTDGYLSRQEQIDRYNEAGERYDQWLKEEYRHELYDPETGEPTEDELSNELPYRGNELDILDAYRAASDIYESSSREVQRLQKELEKAQQVATDAKELQQTAPNAE